MRLKSNLKQDAYLRAMKKRMDRHFSFGSVRFTGFFSGPFFTVTRHCGFQWNRRISNEKISAIGFVKETDSGCQIRCVQIYGLLAPTQFLFTFCWLYLIYLLVFAFKGFAGLEPGTVLGIIALLCFATTLLAALISLLTDRITDAAQLGERDLMALLLAPDEMYSY